MPGWQGSQAHCREQDNEGGPSHVHPHERSRDLGHYQLCPEAGPALSRQQVPMSDWEGGTFGPSHAPAGQLGSSGRWKPARCPGSLAPTAVSSTSFHPTGRHLGRLTVGGLFLSAKGTWKCPLSPRLASLSWEEQTPSWLGLSGAHPGPQFHVTPMWPAGGQHGLWTTDWGQGSPAEQCGSVHLSRLWETRTPGKRGPGQRPRPTHVTAPGRGVGALGTDAEVLH